MTEHLSRRTLLKDVGLLACLLGAGACSTAGFGGQKQSTAGALKVAWWGDADRAELYRKAVDMFAAGKSGLTVTTEYADLDPYLERLATQAAAGKLPDVIWMRDTHVGRYASSNALLDLREDVGKSIDVTALGDASVADGKVGDGVYALPTHYVGQAVFVAGDPMEKAGATYPENGTWNDVAGLAAQLTRKGEFWGCTDPTLGETQRHFEAWVRQSGQELFTAQGQLGFDAEVVGSWLDFWDKLRKAGTIPPADISIEADASREQSLLATGKAAIMWGSSNHFPPFSKLVQGPLEMFSLPMLEGGTDDWWFFPPILISVSAKTKSPDEAAELVDFVLNDEKAADVTKVNQGAPSSSKIRERVLPALSEAEAAFVEQISREMENQRRPNPVRPEGSDQVNSAIQRMSQDVAYGRQTVPAAASALVEESKRALGSS